MRASWVRYCRSQVSDRQYSTVLTLHRPRALANFPRVHTVKNRRADPSHPSIRPSIVPVWIALNGVVLTIPVSNSTLRRAEPR